MRLAAQVKGDVRDRPEPRSLPELVVVLQLILATRRNHIELTGSIQRAWLYLSMWSHLLKAASGCRESGQGYVRVFLIVVAYFLNRAC